MRTMATTGDESEFGILYEILCEDKIIIGDAISIRFLPCANLCSIYVLLCSHVLLYFCYISSLGRLFIFRLVSCICMLTVELGDQLGQGQSIIFENSQKGP